MNSEVETKRGRVKGKTKDVVIIRDEILGDYEIHQDDTCYCIVNVKNQREGAPKNVEGSFHKLKWALDRIAKNQLSQTNKVYTIKQYIDEYENILNKFLDKFPI